MRRPRCSGCDVHPCIGCRGLLVVTEFFGRFAGEPVEYPCPDCAADDWRNWKNGPCGSGSRILVERAVL